MKYGRMKYRRMKYGRMKYGFGTLYETDLI